MIEPFLSVKVIDKTVADLLPGNHTVDIESAYRMLVLFVRFNSFRERFQEYSTYRLVEDHLRKQFHEARTMIAVEGQKDEDIAHVTLLEALIFFRQINQEASRLTRAIEEVWLSLSQQGESDDIKAAVSWSR